MNTTVNELLKQTEILGSHRWPLPHTACIDANPTSSGDTGTATTFFEKPWITEHPQSVADTLTNTHTVTARNNSHAAGGLMIAQQPLVILLHVKAALLSKLQQTTCTKAKASRLYLSHSQQLCI
jgi:hypothetical protein